ncbi:MAG: SDR family oxidoreductase, partial [Catalinimonas sp.]
MNLAEAKVLVTGGNSGIGAAVAQQLVAAGAQVVIAGRNQATLDATAAALGVAAIRADVSNEEDVTRMVREAYEALGGLNVLVNNAGYGYGAPLLQLEAQPFRDVFAVNVLGAALCAREAAKIFVKQDHGNIVNIASTAALRGSPNASPYVATKFALRGMTESWRNELRPHNVRVMLVNPSEVMTEFAGRMQRPDG